jgi:chromosome segregation ATPase
MNKPMAIALAGALALGVGYVGVADYQGREALATQVQDLNSTLKQLSERTELLEESTSKLHAELQNTGQQVGSTEKQLRQASKLARELKAEQEAARAAIADHENWLSSLDTSVDEVETDLAETRQSLETASGRLESVIGDLGIQSGLVARTREELDELKRQGGRDYQEFSLRRSKQFHRVGEVSVRVDKVDPKRNRFTLTLLVNDKVIAKKDRTLYEPVQFYMPGTRSLYELVVFNMAKDQVGGYVSAPKQFTASARPGAQP